VVNNADEASLAGTCASVVALGIFLGLCLEMLCHFLAKILGDYWDLILPSYPLYSFAMIVAIPLSAKVKR
jgi:hypothetical protein